MNEGKIEDMKNKENCGIRKCDILTCKFGKNVAQGRRLGLECVDMKVDGRMVSVRSEEERKDEVFITYEMY